MSHPNSPGNIFAEKTDFINMANQALPDFASPPSPAVHLMPYIHRVALNDDIPEFHRPSASYAKALLSDIPKSVGAIPEYLETFATTDKARSIMEEDTERLEEALQSFEWPHLVLPDCEEIDSRFLTLHAVSLIFNMSTDVTSRRLASANLPPKTQRMRFSRHARIKEVTLIPRQGLKDLVTWKLPLPLIQETKP